jgi:hypothetical protein
MARTPVFQVSAFPYEGTLLSKRAVAVGALAVVSLLLTGLMTALTSLHSASTALWVVPVGIVVLWKMGLFAWVGDVRVGLALRRSPVRGVALERSQDHVRRWLLDPLFSTTVESLAMDRMELSVHWRWTTQGLEAYSFMATGGHGKTLAIRLSNGWAVPPIGWDHPDLVGLAPHQDALLDGHWDGNGDLVVSTDKLPVGSAHARLSLLAWAQVQAPVEGGCT